MSDTFQEEPKRDEPYDLSEPAHVKKRNTDIKRNAVERAATFQAILQHRHGRNFIRWLLDICAVGQSGFSTNALNMAFLAGQRNVGQMLIAELTTIENIDLYFKMLKEGNEQ